MRVLVFVVRVRCLRSRRDWRAERQDGRLQGERRERGQWGRVALQGVEMSENWEEGAGMVVVVREGGKMRFGGGLRGGGGSFVAFVAFVAFVKGVWTCWR